MDESQSPAPETDTPEPDGPSQPETDAHEKIAAADAVATVLEDVAGFIRRHPKAVLEAAQLFARAQSVLSFGEVLQAVAPAAAL